jgi:hypothetical protein
MSGIDLTTVKELMGHRDVKMTLRYAHLAPAHKLKAVNILDNALNGRISSVVDRLLEPHNQQSGEVTQKLTQLGVN